MFETLAERTDVESEEQRETPWLENGSRLNATEFMRRYEAMPKDFKAELIDGTVFIVMSLSSEHGDSDNLLQTVIGTYAIATSGVKASTNSTTILGRDDVPQPDGSLRVLNEFGGRTKRRGRYLDGPPELVFEIAASSQSIDVGKKRTSYQRAGVAEYLVWRTEDEALDWWMLEEDEYRPLPINAEGVIRSRVFPGLWLAVPALVQQDGAHVLKVLHEGLASPEHAAFVEVLRSRDPQAPA